MKKNVVTLVQWFKGGYEPYTPSKEELLNAKFEYVNMGILKPRNICVINKITYTLYFENKQRYDNEPMHHKIILSESEFNYLKMKLL